MREIVETDANEDFLALRQEGKSGEEDVSPPAPGLSPRPASFRVEDVGPRAGGCSFDSGDGAAGRVWGRARTELQLTKVRNESSSHLPAIVGAGCGG